MWNYFFQSIELFETYYLFHLFCLLIFNKSKFCAGIVFSRRVGVAAVSWASTGSILDHIAIAGNNWIIKDDKILKCFNGLKLKFSYNRVLVSSQTQKLMVHLTSCVLAGVFSSKVKALYLNEFN